MASISDIDTKTVVRKYLERTVVVDREDQTADNADEVQAVLEAAALSFLLYPQAALSFILRAKNALQQVVVSDIALVDYLTKAVGDVDNPDDPIEDTSDLIEAQTALVEVDRIGRVGTDVRAYDRYTSAVNRFLDRELATSLKRRRRNEFERSGFEARQDLFRALGAFTPSHALAATRLELLANSVADFQGVDLTKIVSTRTVSRVRSTLQKLLRGIANNIYSKTSVALELLAGTSALQSVSNTRQIYDPTVDSDGFPAGRNIRAFSEPVSATAVGTAGTTDLSGLSTPWVFSMTLDAESSFPLVSSTTLPYTGASGRSWVVSKRDDDSDGYVIPTDQKTLYVQLDGISPPANEPAFVVTITLPTGAQTFGALLTAINTALGSDATAVEVQPGANRFLIYGSSSVTRIIIRSSIPGTFDGVTGVYTTAPGSANEVLGFGHDQTSTAPDLFTPAQLVDFLNLRTLANCEVVDGAPKISSPSTTNLSSVSFSGAVALAFGFSDAEAEPSYLVLKENDAELDPTALGIFVGSLVSVLDSKTPPDRNLLAPVASIDGTHLLFADGLPLPRCVSQRLTVQAPTVAAVQELVDKVRPFVGSLDGDSRELQRVLTPLLSQPTLAQINDAKRSLSEVRDNLSNLLTAMSTIVVTDDQTEFGEVSRNILSSLEERGIDYGIDLLLRGEFSTFFTLTKEAASKGGRFMKAMEQLITQDYPSTTAEQDVRENVSRGSTADKNVLNPAELSSGEKKDIF